ncbi:hypothetical protein C8R47DRAFT_1216092 [Mycena vitilis]|nr:hypothetical protein C8R47DRAFT_1216092 [Mycena vitilis]
MASRKRRRPNPAKKIDDDPYVYSGSVVDFLSGPSHASIETIVERPSADGRRVHTEVLPVAPPSPVKRMLAAAPQHLDPIPMDLDGPPSDTFTAYDMDRYDMELGGFHDRPLLRPRLLLIADHSNLRINRCLNGALFATNIWAN